MFKICLQRYYSQHYKTDKKPSYRNATVLEELPADFDNTNNIKFAVIFQ